MVVDWPDLALRCAANIQYQTGNPLNMLNSIFWVNATLKTVTCVGGKIEPPGPAGHCLWPPKSSFYVNVAGVVRYSGSVSTHDACKRLHL